MHLCISTENVRDALCRGELNFTAQKGDNILTLISYTDTTDYTADNITVCITTELNTDNHSTTLTTPHILIVVCKDTCDIIGCYSILPDELVVVLCDREAIHHSVIIQSMAHAHRADSHDIVEKVAAALPKDKHNFFSCPNSLRFCQLQQYLFE